MKRMPAPSAPDTLPCTLGPAPPSPRPRRGALTGLPLLLGIPALLLSCSPDAPGSGAAGDGDPAEPWEWSREEIVEAAGEARAGRSLQPEAWPGGNRVAVLLSFDVDNETLYIHDDPPSLGALSQGEYGARRGLERVLDVLDRHEIPASFFIPTASLILAPGQADRIARSGRHEFAVHGWIHERNSELDRETVRELTLRAVDYLEELTGERPVGYRAPAWIFTPGTLDVLLELGFLYDSSLMADDRPYELLRRGEPTGLVELPVEWILDDYPLLNPLGGRYSPPREVLRVWIDEFDRAWEEGTVFILTLHPHVIGHRSRILVLEELIRHMREKGDVWFATHREAAEYVRAEAGLGG